MHFVHRSISKLSFGIISVFLSIVLNWKDINILDKWMKVLLSIYKVLPNRIVAFGTPNFKVLFAIDLFSDFQLIIYLSISLSANWI